METFIRKIAQIINESGIPEHELCVVFPNRRAGLFLKRELIPANSPRWLPAMLSIEDFVFEVSHLIEPDNTQLLALLYKAYNQSVQEPAPFDTFLGYGAEILRDFEEVDQYLADPAKLFDYVKQAREIDIWKPGEELTEFEKNYINFYNSLSSQYFALRESCLSRQLAWQGLASRIIAEKPSSSLDNLPWRKIIFAGFNALTPAQLAMIRYLIAKGQAEIIFDADEYYLDNPVAEAGHFLRKYKNDKELGDFREVTSHFLNPDRKIYTCGIPGKTGQARIAGTILNNIPAEEHHLTAIVLADESMLLPVLNSLPDHLDSFNVTMGFPVNQTPLYALIDSIFRLHVNSTPPGSLTPAYYHGDVSAVLGNNYLHRIFDNALATKLINQIRKNNYSYISLSEILSLAGTDLATADAEVLNILFSGCSGTMAMLEKVAQILISLKERLTSLPVKESEEVGKKGTGDEASGYDASDHSDEFNSEILFSIYTIVTNLIESLNREKVEIGTLGTMHAFFRETASPARVPFYGEPLRGIQIMGMLETRVLDFKNVILLSVNEDILPSARSNRSFIPFDIRVHYGLPTHLERQAIFAYHFYHLLQRSTNAWLIYNEDGNNLGGGEKSRYISQLEWELPKKGIVPVPLRTEEPSALNSHQPIVISKDAFVMDKLIEKAGKGFSFSSLKQYINCSLSFYYTYILGLGEPEEVEEDISVRTMGTILHEVLEDIFNPFIDRFPDEATLKDSVSNTGELIAVKTAKTFPALRVNSGRNLLFLKVAETWLKRFLKSELTNLSGNDTPVLKGIELPVTRTLQVQVKDHGTLDVTLYGKIDRIEIRNGVMRVIDYKTGKVDDRDVVASALDDLFNPDKKTDKQLQLLLYKFLAESNPISTGYTIQPGLISFRSLGKGFMALQSDIQTSDFSQRLTALFEEIFNVDIPFTQTEPKHCIYCNFKQICHRS